VLCRCWPPRPSCFRNRCVGHRVWFALAVRLLLWLLHPLKTLFLGLFPQYSDNPARSGQLIAGTSRELPSPFFMRVQVSSGFPGSVPARGYETFIELIPASRRRRLRPLFAVMNRVLCPQTRSWFWVYAPLTTTIVRDVPRRVSFRSLSRTNRMSKYPLPQLTCHVRIFLLL